MNRQAAILVSKLGAAHAQPPVNIFPLVTHCALDIICETAMGRSIDAQANSDTEYVRAVYASSDIVFKRQSFPWLWSDWFFALTPLGRRWRHCLTVLHGFTKSVIQERKAEIIAAEKKLQEEKTTEDPDDVGMKKRMAFLDLLIQESKGGTVLSDEDIRQEVDTFMFEGHDTTATNMTFTLYLLATHPEIQARCQAELDGIFEGTDRDATSKDLGQMKYLESCLKESLR
jgi:cytochrome P450